MDETTKHDTPLGGWHALWLGAAYDLEGDNDAAFIAYGNARRDLAGSMVLPVLQGGRVDKVPVADLNAFGQALKDLLGYTHGNKFEEELAKVRTTLAQ